MITYPVAEKFISINGEGPLAGMLAAFIRLQGCNLHCNYCDTRWANASDCPYTPLTAEDLLSWLKEEGAVRVTLTGGEPLAAPRIDRLIDRLGREGIGVEIETNGSIPLAPFAELAFRPSFTMDYKCPDSGMEAFMVPDNFLLLTRQDTVKFVVSSAGDLRRAREISDDYQLAARCRIYVSPVFGRIDPRDIVAFMRKTHWNAVRLQLQLHKFIWPPLQRGV